MKKFSAALTVLLLILLAPLARAVTLEQTISRETPLHDNAAAEMTVGRDGMIYLSSRASGQYNGYVVRMTRDGKEKTGGDVGAQTGNVAVNKDGILAAANQHFTAAVGLYDREFNRFAEVKEFKAWVPEFGEGSGYNSPTRVLAAPSGDFYALDVFRDNIVRVSPTGRVVRKYPIPRDGTGLNSLNWDFRLDEKGQTFYTRSRELNAMRAIGFDGALKWKATLDISGGWDVGDEGTVYAVSARSDTIQKMARDGKSAGGILLKGEIPGAGDWKSELAKYPITGLRVWDGEIVVKRQHPTEMFLRFDAATGVLRRAVMADFETFKVTYPNETWTAGENVDFQIAHSDPILNSKPQWRVWARNLSTPDYREWKVVGGKLQVPADAAGLIQIKVSPEVQPWLRGQASEYLLQSWVEVRAPNSRGTANLWTPENRAYFARGEAIPFSVLLRGANLGAGNLPVAVRLRERLRLSSPPSAPRERGLGGEGRILAEFQTAIKPGTLSPFKIESSLTDALAPGNYVLEASTPGLTTIAQPLVIGHAPRDDFFQIQYGDYQQPGFFPYEANAWTAPDLVAAHAARLQKIGVNMVVERLGHNIGEVSSSRIAAEMAPLREKLAADALAVASEKALHAPPLLQTMSALGASGVSQMPILLYMDAAIPIGSAAQADGRQFPKLEEDITTVTNALKPYPAFRGWSWVANWWVWDQSKRYAGEAEKTAYEAALKTARETGVWSEVLDVVGARRYSWGVEAEAKFRVLLNRLAPKKVSALSGPYRSIDTFPPLSFANADEVDLHYQAEQIQPPYATWHNVDYQKRQGKIAWGHPELWNDSGTGDMIATNLFGMAMRGVDGVGVSGVAAPHARTAADARSPIFGTTSVFRATFNSFERLGPWMRTLQNADRVAIVVSTRMAKIDDWKGVGGEYFSRLFEAYQSCLFAHRPASFVFAEDLKPDTLGKYDAVLVVGQTVEMETRLKSALDAVKAKVFFDATCRASLVQNFKPLGVAFDNVTKDPHVWQDDDAYPRFSAYMNANAPLLRRALSAVAPPAQIEARDVLISERRNENARVIWVLNTAIPQIDAGAFWKTNKFIASRVPQSPILTIPALATGTVVYDVFAQKIVAAPGGKIAVNLRTLPSRVFAVLPAAIDRVALRGPGSASPGQNLKWWIQARDNANKSIASSVPMRVRLLDGTTIIEERYLACSGAGVAGVLRLPLGASTPVLEATELLGGKSARLNIKIAPLAAPALNAKNALEDAPANVSGQSLPVGSSPGGGSVDSHFGVRLRDVVLASGDTALVSAMSWDENLYALDVATGKTKWKKRVGQQWASAPRALQNGFAVEGVDFENGGGDHLYLAGADGKVSRRFALYDAAKGGVNWAMSGILYDRAANFAVAPDGNWVASAGELGIVAWDKTGKMLWQKPGANKRLRAVATAQDDSTLVIGQGATATAFDARSGAQKWQMSLSANGAIREIIASPDGKTLAIAASSDGGRVFIVRDGKIHATFVSKADEMTLSPDGSTLALTSGNILKIYNGTGGLRWTFGGDDVLHFPRIAPNGNRVVVSSELGTTTVLDMDGRVLHERDLESLAAPAWLPGGDLILAGWNGEVRRVDASFKTIWKSRVQPSPDAAQNADAQIPTARVPISNADAQPAPLAPNLLTETKAIISAQFDGKTIIEWKNDVALLTDGTPDAPEKPWLSWSDIGMIESGWRGEMSLVFDTFHTQLRVKAITVVEDPKNPQSWLRDMNLEYWDAATEKWRFAANLLSDAPTHTHTLPRPIEAAKFRLVKSPGAGIWPIGNVRLGEIVFHGEQIGSSHPDIVARKPLATLFDEGDDLKAVMLNLDYKLEGAFSGGRALQVEAGKAAHPNWTPPFGHALPNWDFPIRETPQPGEYRWLQFAWKALAPETKGISMLLGNPFPGGGVSISVGDIKWNEGVLVEKPIAAAVPQEWQTVRVDLWDVLKKPIDLKSLSLASSGGGAAFDQIVLGKTEADLPPLK